MSQNPIYCYLSESNLTVTPNGIVRQCCKMQGKIGNIKDQSLEDIFNSKESRAIRTSLRAGVWPNECRVCKQAEEMGVASYRQQRNFSDLDNSTHELIKKNASNETGHAEFAPVSLEISFSNLCNLACKMCSPMCSSTLGSVSQGPITAKVQPKVFPILQSTTELRPSFLDEIKALLPTAQRLIISGGEPLMSPDFIDFLDSIAPEIKSGMSLIMTSNLTKLQHGKINLIDKLKGFKKVFISVSIEGTKNVHNYIRHPSNLDVILENVKQLKAQGFWINITMTVGALNVLSLPDAIEMLVKQVNPDFFNFSPVWSVENSRHLHVASLPKELKELAIERFKNFKQLNIHGGTLYEKPISRTIETVIKMLSSDDAGDYELLRAFCKEQDEMYGQSIYDCIPELRELDSK